MSSKFADTLDQALASSHNAVAVEVLESRIKNGVATEAERPLCGVLLLMPPWADYEAASSIFGDMLRNGGRSFDAAVWDAYRYSVLMPEGDRRFEMRLRDSPQSAVSAHMLSLLASSAGDVSQALEENRRSRALRLFPFNIVEGLRRELSLSSDERSHLWRTACDLIFSRTAELDEPVHTVEGSLQRHFDNLILGTRLTTPVWEDLCKTFEIR